MLEVKKDRTAPHVVSHTQLVSGNSIDALLDILVLYRDVTLSRSSYAQATELIIELGGADRLELDVVEDDRKV